MGNKILVLYDKFEEVLCSSCIWVLLFVSTMSVLSRYFLMTPLAWSEELSRFFYMWLVFFSCAYAVRTKALLAIDVLPFLVLKNRPRAWKVLQIFNDLAFIAFCMFMIQRGWYSAIKTVEFSGVLRIPMKFVYMCMPVGSAMIMIRLIQDILKQLMHKEAGKGQIDEVE